MTVVLRTQAAPAVSVAPLAHPQAPASLRFTASAATYPVRGGRQGGAEHGVPAMAAGTVMDTPSAAWGLVERSLLASR